MLTNLLIKRNDVHSMTHERMAGRLELYFKRMSWLLNFYSPTMVFWMSYRSCLVPSFKGSTNSLISFSTLVHIFDILILCTVSIHVLIKVLKLLEKPTRETSVYNLTSRALASACKEYVRRTWKARMICDISI